MLKGGMGVKREGVEGGGRDGVERAGDFQLKCTPNGKVIEGFVPLKNLCALQLPRGPTGGKLERLTDAAAIVVNNNKESRVSGLYANYSTLRATGQIRVRQSGAMFSYRINFCFRFGEEGKNASFARASAGLSSVKRQEVLFFS